MLDFSAFIADRTARLHRPRVSLREIDRWLARPGGVPCFATRKELHMPETKLHLPSGIADNIDQFAGRSWLLQPILDWLKDPTERLLLITGEPGTGKSMLSAWLAGAGPAPTDDDSRTQLEQIRGQVGAIHFCIAASGNITPKAFAQNMADQLTRSIPGFADALVATLSDRVSVSAVVTAGQIAPGGSATGIIINKLDLGELGEELSFERTFRQPLQALYKAGYNRPMLLIVDGMDEAALYTGAVTIVQLLARLTDLAPQVRVLATTRPDPRVLYQFPGLTPIDLIKNAPTGVDDVRQYVQNRLKVLQDEAKRVQLTEQIAKASDGIFLYAYLVLRDLVAGLPALPDLTATPLPRGLAGLYQESFNRQLGPDRGHWFQEYQPLLGLICVAQGGGLTKIQLDRLTKRKVEASLEVLEQYLDGPWPMGPFRPFHKSLADFLLDDKTNVAYHIDAASMHEQVVKYYWGPAKRQQRWIQWDDYALRYMPTHLAQATRGEDIPDRQLYIDRLVTLVIDPAFQQFFQSRNPELAALQGDLELALRVAAADPEPNNLVLTVTAARALVRFRRITMQQNPIFALAGQGGVELAIRQLDLFSLDPDWWQIARLAIAWQAAKKSPAAARSVRDLVAANLRTSSPLPLLLERVDAVLDGTTPMLPALPARPDVSAVRVQHIVEQMGGGEMDTVMLSSRGLVRPNIQGEATGEHGFLAEQDGPFLVAYALHPDTPGEDGDRFLREYVALHASYNYVLYRNNSLRALLGAVLSHPDPAWVLDKLILLVQTALAGSRQDFEEGLPLAVTGWRAHAGQNDALDQLEQARQQALAGVDKLNSDRRRRDTWSFLNRRLGVLAQIYAQLLGRDAEANDLRQKALELRFGAAGLRAPACLTLAETLHVCAPNDPRIDEALDKALTAAHNIQDPSFCARTTSRVNAMRKSWWPDGGIDLATIEQFLKDPTDVRFAALHNVGEAYRQRTVTDAFPMDKLRNAQTLAELADIYQRPLADFQRLNPGWQADKALPFDTLVVVPDPGFAPMLAARFAAECEVAPALSAETRITYIQALVPLAVGNPTALDAVLTQLLLAAGMGRLTDRAVFTQLQAQGLNS